ncbi:MAG TPA: hypothetical protein VGC41_17720, partial [Kofleriaceae bacterium]
AYAERGSERARATYAIDLAAAAGGCLVAPRLIGPLSPIEIIIVLGLVSCVLVRRWLIVLALIALLIASRYLPDGPLAVLLASGPQSDKAIVEAGTSRRDVVDSRWSPLGRLDVHRVPGDRDRYGVFTDGMSPTYMIRAGSTGFETTWGMLMALPYRALHPARVLVLGAGAGASVRLAKKYGAAVVDAVEVNPAIPDLLARWKPFTGDPYHEPGVHLVTADARRFLADTDEHYDLIELALALTGNAHAQPAGLEAHLYTVEAVKLYLRHLSPNGVLVLIHSDPGNAYRQLLTVIAALGDHALDGIVVLRDPRPGTAYRYMIVVQATAMPLDVADRLDAEPAELLWGPGDSLERRRQLLDPAQLGATGRDDLSPVHDDRPYFFQNTKGLVATALAEPARLWVLIAALVLALVASAGQGRAAATATGLGAGYLCVELALIQRFTLAAGGTLYAVSFVLFCLLGWSAVGAVLPRSRGVTRACLLAAAAVAVTAILVRDVSWLDAIASDPGRLATIALLLAPVGLAIGRPFPTLLARPDIRIASLWAVNGAASVAGGIVAVLALRVGGSTDALILASVLYLTAAVVAPRSTLAA